MAAVATLSLSLLSGPADAAAGGVRVADLDGSTDAVTLARSLAGPGVSVGRVTYAGAPTSAGIFTGGGSGPGAVVGFESGVVLSTGSAQVGDHNDFEDANGYSSRQGDPDLDRLGAGTTRDSTVLAFDVTPDRDTLYLNYVFASEEYNEYVYEDVSDVFGFFVTEHGATTPQNCAVVADGPDAGGDPDPVSIDTVNGGNPLGDANARNAGLFRANHPGADKGVAAEPDGFTTILRCVASVTPHQPNRLKLAIADVGDGLLDSWVFLQAGSLTTTGAATEQRPPTSEGQPDIQGKPRSGGPEVGGRADEGAAVTVRGSATGPEDRPLTTRWSVSPGPGVDRGATCVYADPAALTTTVSCTDDGVYTLTLSASHGGRVLGSSATVLEVRNSAPRVAITEPADTGGVSGGDVEVAATVSDPGGNDTGTCSISWGDRSATPGVLADGVCSGRHSYAAIGRYEVRVTVTDDDAASGSAGITLVVASTGSKADGGFVFDGAE